MQIKDYCKIYRNIIPQNFCTRVISEVESHPGWETHTWYAPGDIKAVSRHSKELSILSSFNLQYIEPFVNQAISKYFMDIKSNESLLVTRYSPIRLNRYTEGTLMTEHYDLIRRNSDDGIPVISIVLIFNDDYTGGEFTMNNEVLDLKQGDILIFPSTFLYKHGVSEVIKGIRYSAVTWAY